MSGGFFGIRCPKRGVTGLVDNGIQHSPPFHLTTADAIGKHHYGLKIEILSANPIVLG
jgi:hypothetical protein